MPTPEVAEVWGVALPLFLVCVADVCLLVYVLWLAYKAEQRMGVMNEVQSLVSGHTACTTASVESSEEVGIRDTFAPATAQQDDLGSSSRPGSPNR